MKLECPKLFHTCVGDIVYYKSRHRDTDIMQGVVIEITGDNNLRIRWNGDIRSVSREGGILGDKNGIYYTYEEARDSKKL